MAEPAYEDTLAGGKHWSLIIRRHARLTLTDVEGGANAGMMFYNPQNLCERYNAPDTLKCQHTFRLTAGNCLYSDMGRIFCSVVEDTFGWHDTVCGSSTRTCVASRWGSSTFQSARNDWHQNGTDSFLIEAAKYGLARRDLGMNVNWFSKVTVDDNGNVALDASAARAGARITLRFEMDTLLLIHTCPHPLSTAKSYPRKPVHVAVADGPPAADDDPCRTSAPENGRGFENNRIHHCGCC